jgi:hypothetical protein
VGCETADGPCSGVRGLLRAYGGAQSYFPAATPYDPNITIIDVQLAYRFTKPSTPACFTNERVRTC